MVEENRQPDDQPRPGRWARRLGLGLALVVGLRAALRGPTDVSIPGDREEDHPPPPVGLLHLEIRRELSDVNFRAILMILLSTMVVAAVIYYAVLRFFYNYGEYQVEIKRSHYPLAASEADKLPPQPRLEEVNRMEGDARGNVYLRQADAETILQTYGPIDEGYVHIPIDRAIDLLADKLPVRNKQPSAEQARRQNGLVNAGASNSGRLFRGDIHD